MHLDRVVLVDEQIFQLWQQVVLDLLLAEVLANDSDGLGSTPAHHWSVVLDQLGEFSAHMLLSVLTQSSVDLRVKLACCYSH